MAFIKVPDLPVAGTGDIQYGPHCRASATRLWAVDTLKSLVDAERIDIAAIDQHTTKRDGRLANPMVPYVNAFLKARGDARRVETYWRTESLVVVEAKGTAKPKARKPAAKRVAVTVSPAPVAVVAPAPSPVITSPAVVASPGPVILAAPSGPSFTAEGIPPVGPKTKVSRRRIDGIEYATFTGRTSTTVEARHLDTLTDALTGVGLGEPASVIITGPSGTSKTLLARAFADSVQLPFIKKDGATIRSADDWFGGLRQDPESGRWSWVWNAFGRALIEGTPCVVLLDEANRAETVQALNAMLGLLDETGEVYVAAALTTLHKPKGMLVIVTANKGSEYVATLPFDTAVTQRFGTGGVRLTYLPEKVETQVILDVAPGLDPDIAAGFVRMANQQRGLKDDAQQFPSGIGMSTRMLVEAARTLRRSPRITVRAVLQSTFDAQFEVEDMPALDKVLDFHFPASGNDTLDVDTEAINED